TTGVLGLLVLAWLAAVTLLTVAGEVLPAGTRAGAGARRISARAGPAGLRRLIVLAVGTALLLGTAPAHAAGRQPDRPAPTATDAEISRSWPHWYAANRHVIGPDPDRLQPGQLLRPPPSDLGGQS